MLYFEIIFGAVLCFVAACCLLGSLEEPSLLFLVAILGVPGGFLLSAGIHRHWAEGRAAHADLFRAAVAQGYPVRSDDVYSSYGSSIDVHVGRCLFPLEATRVGGRWRFGVAESGSVSSGGTVFLSPADVAKLGDACPS